jgi:hypothetical protein
MENASRAVSARTSFWLLIVLNAVFMVVTHFPIVSYFAMPLDTFVTALHELSHAVACKVTGGSISGLTIVSDGHGHGGLTWCRGGSMFFVAPAGYLGASLIGCLLLALGRNEATAKRILLGLGIVMFATVAFMSKGLFNGVDAYQTWASILAGSAIGAVLCVGGSMLSPRAAWLILLVVAGQTALNALSSMLTLVLLSTGVFASGAFTDATNMAAITYIPAAVWSVLWGAASVAMVYYTLKRCYRNG